MTTQLVTDPEAVRPALEACDRLGIEIPGPQKNAINRPSKTFIALWNFQEWPSGNVVMEAGRQRLLAGGEFHEPWTVGGRKKGVEKGDRFFLIKVRDGARGVIAAGRALGPLRESTAHRKDGPNQQVMRADIAWDEILTAETLLPKARLRSEIGEQNWTFRVSGVTLDEPHAAALEDLWSEHVGGGRTEPEDAGHFDLEARHARRMSTSRLHQAEFREKLLAAAKYPQCVVCGFDEESLLDAAHIIPDSAGGKSDSLNGRLLCLNHHRAHDRGMFRLVNDQAEWSQDARPFGRPIALETDCATGARMQQ